MREEASKLLGTITFSFKFPEHSSIVMMQTEVRRNLYLAFKEMLNNVVKHSRATHVDIAMAEESQTLRLSVRDNGIGFSPESVKRGEGLNNLKKRADVIGAELKMAGTPGAGSTIVFRLPLSKVRSKA
jgi:signal transduction histidine kinase